GWTLVTTPDPYKGGTNGFEFWNASTDKMTMFNGQLSPKINLAPGSTDNNILELNNGTDNSTPQTLGITRSISTVAGQVYDLSFDYAGRYGYSAAYTQITVTINGVATTYAATSGNTALNWHALDFGFVGTGSPMTITIAATPTTVEAGGRGAMIDNLSLDTQSGLVAGNAVNGTKTDISLSTYVTKAQLTDTDGSEALTVQLTHLPSGAQILVGGVAVAIAADHSVQLTAAQLASAVMRFDASVTGHVDFNVTATSTESSNGSAASSATQAIDLLILSKMTVDAPAAAQVNALSLAATSVASSDTPVMSVPGAASSWQAYNNNLEGHTAGTMSFNAPNAGGTVEVGAQSSYNLTVNPHSASPNPSTNWVLDTEGGNAASPSDVHTTLAFAAGQVVEISMDSIVRNLSLAPAGMDDATQAFNVVWNGVTVATIDPASATSWETDTVRAVGSASGTNSLDLVAVDTTGGVGAAVDNLNVVTVGDAAVGSAAKLASLAGIADFGSSGGTHTLTLDAIPIGATVSDGVHSFTSTTGHTSATVLNEENAGAATGGSNWDLAHLTLTDPGFVGTVVLTATATTTDNGSSSSASTYVDATFAAVTPLTVTDAASTPTKVYGGNGDDSLTGTAGADLIVGGHGNDTMTGGAGADVFKWELSDKGTAAAPAADRITDFDNSANGDKLDLRDLLVGEHDNASSLQNYLHFSVDATGSTKIEVSSSGGFTAGVYAPTAVDQTITLSGVNLVGAFTSDNQVINDLLTRSKIVVDH
ncbi:MAG TPA: type I secretion C-terminal target domain-containing protein, partial [Burkholderiaceae bacterium]